MLRLARLARRDAARASRASALDAVLAALAAARSGCCFFEIEPIAGRLPRRCARGSQRARTSPSCRRGREHHPARGSVRHPQPGYTESRLTPTRTGTPDRGARPGQARAATSSSSTCGRSVPTRTTSSSCTGGNPRQTKGIWDEVHAPTEAGARPAAALGRGRARGDLDRRRLHRRRPARLHARGARVLPPRGALGRRAARDGRDRVSVSDTEGVRHVSPLH